MDTFIKELKLEEIPDGPWKQVAEQIGVENLYTVLRIVGGGMIFSPDISKYLDYLADGGYIEFSGKRVNAYNVYRKDGVVQLTKKGVDLVEGTIEDPGVDV